MAKSKMPRQEREWRDRYKRRIKLLGDAKQAIARAYIGVGTDDREEVRQEILRYLEDLSEPMEGFIFP